MSKTSSQKTHILHVAFTLHDQRIQKWLLNIIQQSTSDKVQIDVLTTADEAPHYKKIICDIGGRLIVAPHPKDKGAFLRFVRGAMTVRQYDVIHVHPFILGGHVLMQAFHQNVPVRIMHAHLDRRKNRRDRGLFKKLNHKISTRLIRRLATYGFAPNEEAANDIFGNDWQRDGRWKLMPYGKDLENLSKGETKQGLRHKLAIPSNAKIIFHPSNFYFEKNHALTLSIFENLAKSQLSLMVLFYGEGPLKEKIQKQVIAKGFDDRVLFVKSHIDIDNLMTMSDMMILPSLYDQDVSPIIEAQIQGLPCLISDQVHLPKELELEDIESLPLEADQSLWQRAIRNILENSDQYQKQNVKMLKHSAFNFKNNVKIFKNLYEQARK